MADAHKNFAYSTVATAPSPATSGTSLVVAAGDGTKFPAVPFNATVWPANAQPTTENAEIVRVTNIATDTLTITRTQESTSARTIVVGDQIAATITVKALTDVETSLALRNVWFHAPATSSTSDSTAASIPRDNTIPQSGEGKEYLTVTVTPKNASSTLEIEFTAWIGTSTISTMTVALFKDSGADALCAEAVVLAAATYATPITLRFIESAGSTSSRTYKIRYGTNSGTAYMLRVSDTDLYSTAKQAVLSVKETLP